MHLHLRQVKQEFTESTQDKTQVWTTSHLLLMLHQWMNKNEHLYGPSRQ